MCNLSREIIYDCQPRIDYSQVMGVRILPFIIELDTQSSILNPGPGQNQRFCYNITGVGQDTSTYADLSHFLFGICDEITEEDLLNVIVFIDGVEQNVVIGDNVEIKTPEDPDNPTGCSGLKFDFGLDKVDGVMNLCYELETPRAIGDNTVCLFGGNVTASSLSICGPICEPPPPPPEDCDTVIKHPVSVCAPVTIYPFAEVGDACVKCIGEPIIEPGTNMCPGNNNNGSCSFTITQQILIKIPIEFGADVEVGDASVDCGNGNDLSAL